MGTFSSRQGGDSAGTFKSVVVWCGSQANGAEVVWPLEDVMIRGETPAATGVGWSGQGEFWDDDRIIEGTVSLYLSYFPR